MYLVFIVVDIGDDLAIDEVHRDFVVAGCVPRREELFLEKESPAGRLLETSFAARYLFALRQGVHDVVDTTAQRRYLSFI